MRNPFTTDLSWLHVSPAASEIRADTNDTVHANVVDLDGVTYPDHTGYTPDTGNLGDTIQPGETTYAQGVESQQIIFSPNPMPAYSFLPNDLATPVDVGSRPGMNDMVVHHGPVTGNVMDVYQEGNVTKIPTDAPGIYGPVGNTEPDYATRAAYAEFATLTQDYSPAVANHQQIAAV